MLVPLHGNCGLASVLGAPKGSHQALLGRRINTYLSIIRTSTVEDDGGMCSDGADFGCARYGAAILTFHTSGQCDERDKVEMPIVKTWTLRIARRSAIIIAILTPRPETCDARSRTICTVPVEKFLNQGLSTLIC